MDLIASLRQRMFPRELRIPRPAWPAEVLDALRGLAFAGPEGDGPGPSPEEVVREEEWLAFLADLGTGLWRVRQKLIDSETGRPPEELRRAFRHLESVWDALSGQGVKIQDHTGEPVPEHGAYGLEALAYEETPSVTRDTVAETVRPSIFYRDRMIQMGQVIVATPQQAKEEP